MEQPGTNGRRAVIASGVAAAYAQEIMNRLRNIELPGFMCIGITHPFPSREVVQFLQNGITDVLVLEEQDPVIEDEIRVLAQEKPVAGEYSWQGLRRLVNRG